MRRAEPPVDPLNGILTFGTTAAVAYAAHVSVENRASEAVGGKWTSKGVIVSESGAALTAAPRQRPWKIPHHWTAGEPAGILLVLESLKITQVVPLAAAQFPRWVPAESGLFAEQLPADLQGDVRGRRVSESDLRVDISAKSRCPVEH